MTDSNTYACSDQKVWTEDAVKVRLASGRGIPLRLLSPGEKFQLTFMPEVCGVVDSHGNMGSRVRFGSGIKVKQVKDHDGNILAEFESKSAPEIISSEAEVVPLSSE